MALIERTIRERIILVGVTIPPETTDETDPHLDELAQLVDTAGADVVGRVFQRRDAPDSATYLGKGKIEELREESLMLDSDTTVFDNDLSPAQQRNLEKALGRTAISRTEVILDIFAQNARTPEGRAQVELARAIACPASAVAASSCRGRPARPASVAVGEGGARIGGRGPGETSFEIDRRRLLTRMSRLERDLEELSKTRRTQRKARTRSGIRTASIVGYTNAGKSTLLNQLTDAGVLVEDRLFATLDPRARRLDLPGGEAVVLTDTVGFIRKLPHQLVEAFKSTLELVAESDLLVHVVDASCADPDGQIAAVRIVLDEIGARDVPELLVFNKIDVTTEGKRLVEAHPGSVAISAVTGAGVDGLLDVLGDRLRAMSTIVELVVPYERGDVLAAIHREGEVLVEQHEDAGTRVRARLDDAPRSRFSEFIAS